MFMISKHISDVGALKPRRCQIRREIIAEQSKQNV